MYLCVVIVEEEHGVPGMGGEKQRSLERQAGAHVLHGRCALREVPAFMYVYVYIKSINALLRQYIQ
jgi:hypothetical protein